MQHISIITKTLSDSIVYEKHRMLLARANAIFELSKRAYKKYSRHQSIAEKEMAVLMSGKWRDYPLVTIQSQAKAEHKADISHRAAQRLFGMYKRLLYKMFYSSNLHREDITIN
jgi:hypothetical protein